MKRKKWQIESSSEALLFLDYMAKFSDGDFSQACGGIAGVIRELMGRLERQAMHMERQEAGNDVASKDFPLLNDDPGAAL